MKALTCSVAVFVLAGDLGVNAMAGRAFAQTTEQRAAPKEQAAAEQPPATQPTVSPEQHAAAEKLGLPVVITNSIGMKLALIPAGEFQMGSPATDEWRESAEQQHRVRITKSFYLGVYEVTQEQYKRVMGVNPSNFKGPQHPVEVVSWEYAVKFCDRLSALPEEKAAGRIYRLPAEAQWEYACRAGSTTRYSYGDNPASLGDHAWFRDNSLATTHSVGEKRPNAWGLYDMHGNVWEWCADRYRKYAHTPVDDPIGPTTGSYRVYRGGSWFYSASYCRSAYRFRIEPGYHNDDRGFRVALDVAEKVEPPKEAK